MDNEKRDPNEVQKSDKPLDIAANADDRSGTKTDEIFESDQDTIDKKSPANQSDTFKK